MEAVLRNSRRAPRDDWKRYPYTLSTTVESFSQALFRLLKIPEVASDLSGNITMHQILRLLYADQLSPIEDIFRFQRFDDGRLRDTVGRLLCGAYDSALYDNSQKITALQKDYDIVSGELKSLFGAFSKTGQALTLEWLQSERKSLEDKQEALHKEIELAEQRLYSSATKDELTLQTQNKTYAEVQKAQAELGQASAERDALLVSMADSANFILSLQSKIEALADASTVASHLGDIRFNSCPACYAPVEENTTDHACHLCRTPFQSEQTRNRITALISDTALQLKQSEHLQRLREERLRKMSQRVLDIQRLWETASRRLSTLERLPSSVERQRLRDLFQNSGYLERRVEDLNQQEAIIRLIREKSDEKDRLNAEISRLESKTETCR